MRPLLSLLLAARFALGCSCAPAQPLCQRIDRVKVLFIGTATATNDNHDGFLKGGIWYRFSVDEAFKGIASNVKEVIVDPMSGTSCQDEYTVGKRYLIVSYGSAVSDQPFAATSTGYPTVAGGRPQGPLVTTGVCSGSGQVEQAADDIAFARQYSRAPQPATIFGFTRMNIAPYVPERSPGLSGVALSITGQGKQYALQTRTDGRFDIPNVPPGVYSVNASLTGFKMDPLVSPLTVPVNGCGVAQIGMRTNGTLKGVLLHADGKPAAGIEVQYGYSDPRLPFLRSVKTDEKGTFTFTGVPAAELRVGVHLWDAPDKELPYAPAFTTVTLSPNETRSVRVKLERPLKWRSVTVLVRWPDGRPAADTYVTALIGRSSAEFDRTGGDGIARLTLLEGLQYRIEARGWSSYRVVPSGMRVGEKYVDAEPTPFSLGTSSERLSLVLTKPQPVH